jgi:hypothetical protein
MAEDFEQAEYFALVNAVEDFDRRLLTIKGWGVSLSLVALGLGFQYRAFGFFLIAAASSLAFWAIEAVTKRHQIRNYPRIREIEVNRYKKASADERPYSAPRMNWSWTQAKLVFAGRGALGAEITEIQSGPNRGYMYSFAFPHVALPHAITFAIAVALFVLGCTGHLPGFALGAVSTR